MKSVNVATRTRVLALLILPLLLGVSLSASAAEKIFRIITLTAASAQAQEMETTTLNAGFAKVYKAAKGCESVTFFTDAATNTTGSASVWTNRADFDAFAKSADYLALRAKLKPLTTGTPVEKIYTVLEPK